MDAIRNELLPLKDYVMDRESLKEYLKRIGLNDLADDVALGRNINNDYALLERIQRAHLETVPFENHDISAGQIPLPLDLGSLFEKIVAQRRGGICYEQNLLFAAALQGLGFNVKMRAGRHPKYGNDMDHVFLQVDLPKEDTPYLADVGFAVNFARPLRLTIGEEQSDGRNRFVLVEAPEVGPGYVRIDCIAGMQGEAEPAEMFTFTPETYEPCDCVERCYWYCTSPKSRFTQGPLISIDAPDGRKTLSANHFVATCGDERQSVDIESSEQYERYLREVFGLNPIEPTN